MNHATLNPYEAPNATIVADEGPQDFPLAEPTTRLWAALLDGCLIIPVFIIFVVLTQLDSSLSGLAGSAAAFVLGTYQIVLLSTQGQTLGKKWLGMKIVTLDGQNPGFVKAVLLRLVANGVLRFIPFYALVDALYIFRADRRCIHDLIAGTQVVRLR